jgi:hypothetical protein
MGDFKKIRSLEQVQVQEVWVLEDPEALEERAPEVSISPPSTLSPSNFALVLNYWSVKPLVPTSVATLWLLLNSGRTESSSGSRAEANILKHIRKEWPQLRDRLSVKSPDASTDASSPTHNNSPANEPTTTTDSESTDLMESFVAMRQKSSTKPTAWDARGW